MKDGRTEITQAYRAAMPDAYLYCIQKGIRFPSSDYSRIPSRIVYLAESTNDLH